MRKGDVIWGGILILIITFLAIPATNSVFTAATAVVPYLMGFIKFAVLAMMGELLALRIIIGKWEKPEGFFKKSFVWGIIGIMIVFAYQLFPSGVSSIARSWHIFNDGWLSVFLIALLTSAVMNITFGTLFMAFHRFTDTYIDGNVHGKKLSADQAIDKIDWSGFIKFVVLKTMPFFWIPAHTIVILLPEDYRVLTAAFLSIALGAILAYAKRRKSKMCNI
jgi:MFS family permease